MKVKNDIKSEVEKTLSSLDSWKEIKTDSFFYTRLSVRLEKKTQFSLLNWLFDSPILRPALIAITLLINIFSINYYLSTSNNSAAQSNDFATLFVDEYM